MYDIFNYRNEGLFLNIIDITGPIYEGMWNYEDPFPKFKMEPLGEVPWVKGEVFCEIFKGLHSQTGTYLETPAHFYGNDNYYLVDDIPIEKIVNIPCYVINLAEKDYNYREAYSTRKPIDVDMLELACSGENNISENCAILVGTGWGKHWKEEFYLEGSPYFTYEAMDWLLSKKPVLLGTDFPRWENIEKPEGFFKDFYAADILMLAPCVNLEKITKKKVKLTALPLRIPGTSSIPCRAVVVEE